MMSEECEEPEDCMEERQEPLINSCLHPGLLQPRVWPLSDSGDPQEEEAGASSSVLPFSMMQGGQTRMKWSVNGSRRNLEVVSYVHVGLVGLFDILVPSRDDVTYQTLRSRE